MDRSHVIISFLRNWTLPSAIVFGTTVYLLFAYIPILDGPAQVFGPIINAIFPVFMAFILFVVFCKVDFKRLRLVAWHGWVSLFQVLFVVLILLFAAAFRPSGDALVGLEALLCCVVAPCAAAAPVVTQKLGGNLEEMTSYTFLSNFITALLIPAVFPLVDERADIPFFESFLRILSGVVMVLIVPMGAAYVVKHYMKRFHRWIVSVKDLSYYAWAVSLTIVSGTTVKNIVHADTTAWLLLAVAALGMMMCLVQFAVGRFVGRFFGATTEAGQGLGQKNTAFAIWVAFTYLNPVASIGPGCYILWQNMVNSIEIWHHEKAVH